MTLHGVARRGQRFWQSHAMRRAFAVGLLLASIGWLWRYRVVADAVQRSYLTTEDLFSYFYPMLATGYERMREGRMFLWNPHQLSGMPALASLQPGYLYPPHLLYLVVPTAQCMGLMALGHTVFASCGILCLLRNRGFGWMSATTGAWYFAVAAILPLLKWPPGMEAASWLPAGIAAIERVLRDRDRRWLIAVVLSVSMPLLAGGYQTTVAIYYCFGLWALGMTLYRLHTESLQWRAGVTDAATIAAAGIVGILCAAPQILPTLELSSFAERATSTLAAGQVVPFWKLRGALQVRLFTRPLEVLQLHDFVGVVALLLAGLGVIKGRGYSAALMLLVVFGVLSLGAPTWFVSLRTYIPVLGWFRLPDREFFLAKFAITILLASGIELLHETAQPLVVWRRMLILAALLCACVVTLESAQRFYATATAAMTLTLAAVALLVARHKIKQFVCIVLVGLLWRDVVAVPTNHQALPYAKDAWRQIYDDEPLHRVLSVLGGRQRSLVVSPPERVKASMLFGTRSPIDYDPLVLSYLHRCIRTAKPSAGFSRPGREWAFLGVPVDMVEMLAAPLRRCLDLAAVSFAVVPSISRMSAGPLPGWVRSDEQLPVPDWAAGEPAFLPILLRNLRAVPRSYGVYSAECAPTHDAEIARALSESFDPRTTVVLEAGDSCALPLPTVPRVAAPMARIVDETDTDVRVVLKMAAPGYLILADSYYPGWDATVNNLPVPIRRANGMYRAVPVPVGESVVEFRYRPRSFYLGCGMFGAGLVTLLGACLRSHVISKREPVKRDVQA